jgi:hypothetical protein
VECRCSKYGQFYGDGRCSSCYHKARYRRVKAQSFTCAKCLQLKTGKMRLGLCTKCYAQQRRRALSPKRKRRSSTAADKQPSVDHLEQSPPASMSVSLGTSPASSAVTPPPAAALSESSASPPAVVAVPGHHGPLLPTLPQKRRARPAELDTVVMGEHVLLPAEQTVSFLGETQPDQSGLFTQ